ncbi:MAG: M20/M25/M40 family metallo-hydrolase [Chlamydiae bacterium]|nr:M20/M25/M40 family metallo-hydrolase [Chlamydiota bacterium]
MKEPLSHLKKWYSKNFPQILKDYTTLLKFKTISSDHKYDKEIDLCAKWIKNYLHKKGLIAEIVETPGRPLVYAHNKFKKGAKTVLLYNHMDVQPITPLKEWKNDPFVPKFEKDKVYARGASDNKGQLFYTMLAASYLADLDLPLNIKLCIESEEESSSFGLHKAIKDLKTKLQADYLIVLDVGFKTRNEPAVVMGARGLCALTAEFIGSNVDLHSGGHGGIVNNPLKMAVEILSKCYDKNGKVAIPHFYDDVKEMTKEEEKMFDTSFDKRAYQKNFGVKYFAKHPGGSSLHAAWMYPTLEINGIGGGFFEEGFKTVIPAKTIVKISCRLVPNQDPNKIIKLVSDFIKKEAKGKIDVNIKIHEGGFAVRGKKDSAIVKAATKGYEEVFKKPCKRILEGGSVPIIADIVKTLNCDVVMMGVALPEDNFHAPNESFDLVRMEQGFQAVVRTLENLADKC